MAPSKPPIVDEFSGAQATTCFRFAGYGTKVASTNGQDKQWQYILMEIKLPQFVPPLRFVCLLFSWQDYIPENTSSSPLAQMTSSCFGVV